MICCLMKGNFIYHPANSSSVTFSVWIESSSSLVGILHFKCYCKLLLTLKIVFWELSSCFSTWWTCIYFSFAKKYYLHVPMLENNEWIREYVDFIGKVPLFSVVVMLMHMQFAGLKGLFLSILFWRTVFMTYRNRSLLLLLLLHGAWGKGSGRVTSICLFAQPLNAVCQPYGLNAEGLFYIEWKAGEVVLKIQAKPLNETAMPKEKG